MLKKQDLFVSAVTPESSVSSTIAAAFNRLEKLLPYNQDLIFEFRELFFQVQSSNLSEKQDAIVASIIDGTNHLNKNLNKLTIISNMGADDVKDAETTAVEIVKRFIDCLNDIKQKHAKKIEQHLEEQLNNIKNHYSSITKPKVEKITVEEKKEALTDGKLQDKVKTHIHLVPSLPTETFSERVLRLKAQKEKELCGLKREDNV